MISLIRLLSLVDSAKFYESDGEYFIEYKSKGNMPTTFASGKKLELLIETICKRIETKETIGKLL